MKAKKRFLGLLLTLSMVLSLLPNTVFAENLAKSSSENTDTGNNFSILPAGEIFLKVGESLELELANLPVGSTEADVTWEYSDEYLSMSGNTITANAPGVINITAKITLEDEIIASDSRDVIIYALAGVCGAEGDGSNVSWKIDPDSNTLTISGNGPMQDYISTYSISGTEYNSAPWYPYCRFTRGNNSIGEELTVIVADGVTSIGNYAFSTEFDTINATKVELPDSITRLGKHTGIKYLSSLPQNLEVLDDEALYGTTFLNNSVYIPESVRSVGNYALYSTTWPDTPNLDAAFFYGNAPESFGENVFCDSDAFTIYYIVGTGGWTDSDAYDAAAETWNGYRLKQWSSDSEVKVVSKTPDELMWKKYTKNISITFDHEIASIDTSGNSGRFRIVTKNSSDDLIIVYQLSDTSLIEIDGSTLTIDVTKLNWELNKEYNVLLDYGVITFKNTNSSIGYSYGQWRFRTPAINLAFDDPNVWKFSNSYGAFGIEDVSSGYYITSTDYNRLVSKLSNSEKKRISTSLLDSTYNIDGQNNKNTNWIGSCYGMSVWVCLASRGIRSAEEISTGYPNLYSVDYPFEDEDIASAINYYQQQQRLSGIKAQQSKFNRLSLREELEELERVARNAEATGEYGLILMDWHNGLSFHKHATVVYGYEDGKEWTVEANGTTKTYTKRALVYDCSAPYFDTFDDYCIYFDDTSWCIPGWNITNTFRYPYGELGNGCFVLITDDVQVLNTVDFATGNVSSEAYRDSIFDVFFEFGAASAFELRSGDNICVVENGTILESSFNEQPDLIFDAAILAGEDSSLFETATLVLHDSDSTYTINTQDPICYDIKYGNYYMAAISDATGSVEFSPDGGIQLKGDMDTDYTLQLVADDGYHTLPWYEVSITGNNSTNIAAEWVPDGVSISGDNLNNITVYASDDQETVELNLDTDYDDILIKENSGSLEAYIDTDNDGKFETPINNNDNNQDSGNSSGGGSIATFSIHANDPVHGTISVSRPNASKGTTITISTIPDNGYVLNTITATDKNGNDIELFDQGLGKHTFVMPASDVTVEATFMPAEENNSVDSFLDVDSTAWYYDAVKYVVENGIMSGTGTYTFEPNTTLSRGMIAQMLYALEGKPNVSVTGYFNDVPVNAWFAKAAAWAQSKGIITGYDNGNFGPNDPLTREQLALILYNYAKTKEYSTSAAGNLSQFIDGRSTSAWAQEGMTWAVGAGLLSGRDGNTLCATGTATRAEVAQIMMNFCENVAK